MPDAYMARHLIGDTTGPRPIVSPGSAHPVLGAEFGVGAERRNSPEFILGGPVGLSLGVALAAAPGEAVSAGPVWDVSRYLLTDGAVYAASPAMDLSAQHELVVCWERDTAVSTHYPVAARSSALVTRLAAYASLLRHAAYSITGGVSREADLGSAVSGRVVDFCPLVYLGGGFPWGPRLSHNGAALINESTQLSHGHSSSVEVLAGASKMPNLAASSPGMRIRWVGVVAAGLLSSGSRTAVAGAPLSDPRDLAAESFARLWPMGLVYDAGGGVYKVRDLITTDGSTDLTVVSGDLGDFPEA